MEKFNISKVSTIVIHVKDMEASTAFYENILGLKKDEETEDMVWLSVGEGKEAVPIMLHISEITEPVENGLAIDLTVDNVDALVASVEKSDFGKVVQQPVHREWGVKEAVLEDPDGYLLWFTQPLGK